MNRQAIELAVLQKLAASGCAERAGLLRVTLFLIRVLQLQKV
jgi:hypothetical protein